MGGTGLSSVKICSEFAREEWKKTVYLEQYERSSGEANLGFFYFSLSGFRLLNPYSH